MYSRRYCLISPCRDEVQYARRCIDSVLAQSELPALWVIVDDGSTDGTTELLASFAQAYSWIRVVRREAATRRLGGGVIEAFDAGLATVDLDEFDYVCKFDLDLDLPAGYFARMMDETDDDPRLASVSGKPYYYLDADPTRRWERCGDENSVGMTKFYRVEAFRDIGGFARELMWDGIDCHTASSRGWRCRAINDPDAAFEHLRPMGSSDRGILRGRRRHGYGYGQYYMGSGPLFVVASAAFRLRDDPKALGSINMVAGYLGAALKRVPRHGDAAFRKHLRTFQRESLVLGKDAATRRWERRTEPLWRSREPVR